MLQNNKGFTLTIKNKNKLIYILCTSMSVTKKKKETETEQVYSLIIKIDPGMFMHGLNSI